jgi:hypothetical protein
MTSRGDNPRPSPSRALIPLEGMTSEMWTTERRDTSLEDYVPACDMIIGHLYEASQRFKRLSDTADNESEAQMYEWLHISAEAAWDKANALYKKVDDSPAYYAALTMDPRYKFEWFEQRWGSNPTKREWLQGAKAVVREHWQKYRSRHHSQDSNSTSQRPQKAQVLTRNLNDDDEFDTGALADIIRSRTPEN